MRKRLLLSDLWQFCQSKNIACDGKKETTLKIYAESYKVISTIYVGNTAVVRVFPFSAVFLICKKGKDFCKTI